MSGADRPTQEGIPRAVILQRLLSAGYVGFVLFCFLTPWGPRVFWTMLLPILPAGIVLMGFYTWREICPLAFWGSLGLRLKRKGSPLRRVPEWMERWFFLISGGFLTAMLVVRFTLTNGDGLYLGWTLIILGLLAALTNLLFHGKSWCNFICPIGAVERIYTDPISLISPSSNSQCGKCTACKRHCPDIDQEKNTWKDIGQPGRRIAFYSFPGVVLGFYTYYWLRGGNWEAYFGGEWTSMTASMDLVVGPGFFFAPKVPIVIASAASLLLFAALSYGVFVLIEKGMGRWAVEKDRQQHLTQTLAAFIAFNVFYLFAGAPALRKLPGSVEVVGFLIPLISTLFLVKRWRRDQEGYLTDQGVKKLLKNWIFPEPPPKRPHDVLAYVKAQEKAHEVQLAAYREIVCDMLAEGEIRQRDLRLLERLRRDLGVSDGEHQKILTVLSEEEKDLFEPESAVRVEQSLQLAGYRMALSMALIQNPPSHEIDALRMDYGISREIHEALLQEMRRPSAEFIEKAARQFERIETLREWMLNVNTRPRPVPPDVFVLLVLRKSQERSVRRIVDLIAWMEGKDRIHEVLEGLFSNDTPVRMDRLARLRLMTESRVAARLEPIILDWIPGGDGQSGEDLFPRTMEGLASSPDPYLRAGVLHLIHDDPAADGGLRDTIVGSLSEDRLFFGQTESEIVAAVDRMQALSHVPLFSNMDPEDLHELSQSAVEQTIIPPDDLVTQGDYGDELYVILEGEAAVMVDRNGERREIGVLGPGDVVGELAAIDGSPRSATVSPRMKTLRVLRVNRKGFHRLLDRSPEIARTVMTIIASRLRRVLGG